MAINSWEFLRAAQPMLTSDFFRARLETMIELRHPLAVLTKRMPWASIEASLAPLFERKPGKSRRLGDADLFGQSVQLAGVVSAAGRPRLPNRLMVALLFLNHAYNVGPAKPLEPA